MRVLVQVGGSVIRTNTSKVCEVLRKSILTDAYIRNRILLLSSKHWPGYGKAAICRWRLARVDPPIYLPLNSKLSLEYTTCNKASLLQSVSEDPKISVECRMLTPISIMMCGINL